MRLVVSLSVVVGSWWSLVACPTPISSGEGEGEGEGEQVVSCVDDSECPGGFCLNGLCAAAECETKATCPATEVCIDGRCGPPPATCASPEDCPGQLVCDGFTDRCFDPSEGEGEGEGGEGEGEGGAPIDLGGFIVENREHDPIIQASVLPDGTDIEPGQVIVIGRDAPRDAFEQAWGPLPADAVYINGEAGSSGVPIVNGNERFTLRDGNDRIDGPTIAGGEQTSYQRVSAGDAADAASWEEHPDLEATPGACAAPAGAGLIICEWSDSGEADFDFEFVELAYLP